MTLKAYENGWPLLVHTNGDAATDMYIQAVRLAEQNYPDTEIRPVIIHAQTMRDDQLDAAHDLGMIPSFFADHIYYWGDRHRDIFLGPERASRISPAGSAKEKNILFTLHDDAPVVKPNPLLSVWAAVNRQTQAGDILGADQKISAYDALRAVTYNAAYQHFEENQKGTLEPGKLADMVILDQNPLKADLAAIKDINIAATYKEGVLVFENKRMP